MPQAANIVINDGAATPVAHTFTPIGKDDKGVIWYEQTLPVPVSPVSAKRLSYKQTKEFAPARADSYTTAAYTLWVPTAETMANNSAGITPPVQLAYREEARINFRLADRSVKQERKDTRVLTINLLGHASVVSNVDDLQPTYA